MGYTALEIFEQEKKRQSLERERRLTQAYTSSAGVFTAISVMIPVVTLFGENIQKVTQQATEYIIPDVGFEIPALICFGLTVFSTGVLSLVGGVVGYNIAEEGYHQEALELEVAHIQRKPKRLLVPQS